MTTIPILLGTTRTGNQSTQVANFLVKKISIIDGIHAPLLDLGVADFPMLTERATIDNPITPLLAEWTSIIEKANGLIIVSPEYKGGYPGSLKNFLDYLPPGIFRYMPIGISTVSAGVFAGSSCLQQLRQVVISMAGVVIPDRFQIGLVQSAFNLENIPISENTIQTAEKFVNELIKYTQTLKLLQNR